MATPRTIHLVSLGCPKNRVDSEVMLGVAANAGLSITTDAEDAEIIVVNTCGFIGEAKKESIDTIFELAELKKHGRLQKLVVAGCLSQRLGAEHAGPHQAVEGIGVARRQHGDRLAHFVERLQFEVHGSSLGEARSAGRAPRRVACEGVRTPQYSHGPRVA